MKRKRASTDDISSSIYKRQKQSNAISIPKNQSGYDTQPALGVANMFTTTASNGNRAFFYEDQSMSIEVDLNEDDIGLPYQVLAEEARKVNAQQWNEEEVDAMFVDDGLWWCFC